MAEENRPKRRAINDVLDIIRRDNLVESEVLDRIIEEAKAAQIHPADFLVRNKYITKNQLTACIAATFHCRYIDLSETIIDPQMAKLLPSDFAKRHKVVPVDSTNKSKLVVAVPLKLASNLELNDRIRQTTGFSFVEFVVSPNDQIDAALKEIYRVDEEMVEITNSVLDDAHDSDIEELGDEEEITDESDVERFVRLALQQAVEDGASDIIFESREEGLLLRYRIDGRWYHKTNAPNGMADEIISVIKIQSNLDISVKKRGQDGRMFILHNGNKIDFRVNIFPIQDGENITMRIIDNSQANLRLEQLGFSDHNLERFMSAITKPQGLILVTGPTGSGKSVTLYSGLNVIASRENNTYTIEDPIEYRVKNVKQSQIDVKAGWTYPKAIESFMRAAPDNILVGEIRNLETARMALEAGMTGHLVLSTLHTNSAAEAAARLTDMGAEPDIVSMTLTAIVAQRLVRKLCVRCKEEVVPDPKELLMIGFPWEEGTPLPKLYGPHEGGCKDCKGLGFRGRTAAHEILLLNTDIRELIIKRSTAKEIEQAAIDNGMTKMIQDGFLKVLQGVTTIPEVFSAITTV